METKNNPFQEIAPKDLAPKSLKKEVMTSISFSRMLTQVADLFTVKMSGTLINMVQNSSKNPESIENKKEDDDSGE